MLCIPVMTTKLSQLSEKRPVGNLLSRCIAAYNIYGPPVQNVHEVSKLHFQGSVLMSVLYISHMYLDDP